MTTFDGWDDILCHHGIKGQKWGVRRFQNKDGTLTEAGRKRLLKSNYGYLNPKREEIGKGKAKNRWLVSQQYGKEYWQKVHSGMPENSPSKVGKALWEKYKPLYASAALKDLGLADTEKGRRHVQKIFAETDPDYEYERDKK